MIPAFPIARPFWMVLTISLFSFMGVSLTSYSQSSSTAVVGVPSVDCVYEEDVRQWWSRHPLNPKSEQVVQRIQSPKPVVTLNAGESIDEAVKKLPEAGGTLRLVAGTYGPFAIIGRSNIHILGPESGEALITGHSYLAVCPEAMDYVEFDKQVSHFDTHKYRDKRVWDLYKNPTRNFLLKNLIFDGEGKTIVDFPGAGIKGKGGALGLKRVRDVVVENCIFRNFVDTPNALQHCGLAWGHYGLTNVWFRGCKFMGTAKYAVYLDGAHASGFIGCTIEGKGCKDGGLLFLANHDFTDDLDENGKIDPVEEKCAKFVVIAGNTFDWAGGTPIRFTGQNLLVEANTFNGVMLEVVGVYPTGEVAHRTWPAGHLKIRIVGNTVGNCARALLNIFDLNPAKVQLAQEAPLDLQYTVEGNIVAKTPEQVRFTPLRP
jgi:hypothetical protein